MEKSYSTPSDLTAPIHNAKPAPRPESEGATFDSGYMDGVCTPYAGANPGRDQDRSRVDECQPASYKYNATSYSSENETGMMEGY